MNGTCAHKEKAQKTSENFKNLPNVLTYFFPSPRKEHFSLARVVPTGMRCAQCAVESGQAISYMSSKLIRLKIHKSKGQLFTSYK